MSAVDSVLFEVADGVATVTLNRPGASNAVDLGLTRALAAAVAAVAADDAARVLLLCGAGKRFCAGGDLGAMDAAPDRGAFIRELAGAAHEVVRALDRLEKPVVAAVQGAAAGIGLSFVLGADLVVAGAGAKFVSAYTSVGLTPDGGQSWLLPRIVGARRAAEIVLLSEPLSAERALEYGIVSAVVEDGSELARARELAAALAARPAQALGPARRLLRDGMDRSLSDHLDAEAAAITAAASTEATGALIARFLGR